MDFQDQLSELTALARAGFCETKLRLIAEFQDAVREMNTLHSEQMRAAISDDPDFGRFDLLLHAAQEKKDRAKYALINHVAEHGCMTGGAIFA